MINTREYKFKNDIVLGEKGEDDVISYMESLGMTFLGKSLGSASYDAVMQYNNKVFTYEIKTDVYPIDTGRMIIEFESRGKPSGIFVTKADYFVYYYKHTREIWNIKVSSLKNIIELFYDKIVVLNNIGDDNSNTRGFAIERNKFIKNFKIHKI